MKILNRFICVFLVLLSISLPAGNTYTTSELGANEPEMSREELLKAAQELFSEGGLLEGLSLSQEDKDKILNDTVDETLKIMSLPKEEQEKFVKDAEEFLTKALEEESLKMEPEVEEQPKVEEEVRPAVKEEKPAFTSKTQTIKELLNNLVVKIGSLILKACSLPRVSQDQSLEQKWNKLLPSLRELESLLKLIVKKNNLLNLLTSNEFELLIKNLTNFNKELEQKESKLVVPDTAGLKISFEDEMTEEEFAQAQEQFKDIILLLSNVIEEKHVVKDFKEFLEKHAPKELKEIKKELETQLPAGSSMSPACPSPSVPQTGISGNVGSLPSFGNKADFNRSYFNEPRAVPAPSNMPLPGLSPVSGELPGKPADKQAPGKDAEQKEKGKEDKEKKPEKPKKPKESEKKPEKTTDAYTELENQLKKISDVLLPESAEKKGDKKVEAKSRRSPIGSINFEVIMDYDKAISYAEKLSKDTKENYENKLKELYNNPELKLEEVYDSLIKLGSQVNIVSERAKAKLLHEIISKHEQLRKLMGFEKEKPDSSKASKK